MFSRKAPNLAVVAWLVAAGPIVHLQPAQSPVPKQNDSLAGSCRIEAVSFDGWQAEEMTNRWLKLTLVPKLGGRLMQLAFAGHEFLFVNSRYTGQSVPPSEDTRRWINYGGDKIWPMPEGDQDDQHWPGPYSGLLDDGEYLLQVISQGPRCAVRLEGPPDQRTGLQYAREISIESDSPQISFRATMKNSSTRTIRWSVQSVTQYDTADTKHPPDYNHDFWAFTPVNAQSAYLDGYHVRSGVADDPSFSAKDGMFLLHWLFLQGEVWVDSPTGWLAVVDGATQFAMIERFHFDSGGEYPGKATVIFYKNGPAVGFDSQGKAVIRTSSEDAPLYMEAELNSPMVKLAPGESYTFTTEWFPTRADHQVKSVTDAGVIGEALTATSTGDAVKLSGTLGVFFAGQVVAHILNKSGSDVATIPIEAVDPAGIVKLGQRIKVPSEAKKMSLHLKSGDGVDRGSLGECEIVGPGGGS